MDKSILIIEELWEMERLNSLLGFIQVAFAEADGLTNTEEAAGALYHIYTAQAKILEKLKGIFGVTKMLQLKRTTMQWTTLDITL